MKFLLPTRTSLSTIFISSIFTLSALSLSFSLSGCGGGGGSLRIQAIGTFEPLQQNDVELILAQAVTHAILLGEEVGVAVTDKDGRILGEVLMSGAPGGQAGETLEDLVESRAGLAANFSSDGEAFTSETIAFIIDDHFPPENIDAATGPLFGTENSSFPTGDVTSVAHFGNAVTGPIAGRTPAGAGQIGSVDANLLPANFANLPFSERAAGLREAIKGALPLFRNGRFIGGIGVGGASSGVRNLEITLAGWQGFEAPTEIRANGVFILGLAIPFGTDILQNPIQPLQNFANLQGAGRITIPAEAVGTPRNTPPTGAIAFPGAGQNATFGGVNGVIKNPILNSPNNAAGPQGAVTQPLTTVDVQNIINSAVDRARTARAGIRRPLGSFVVIHVAVVDQNGELLGVFAMDDATVFSYDVAVQKARTVAFFSTNNIGFGCRSIGFLAQPNFPPNLEGITAPDGPLNGVQAAFNQDPLVGIGLDSGFQVFPGGLPLYRNGELVGGVGISGDGVDQDDLAAFAGTQAGFDAGDKRVDTVSNNNKPSIITALTAALDRIETAVNNGTDPTLPVARGQAILQAVQTSKQRLQNNDFQSAFNNVESIPYVKFPNRPDL